MKARNKRTAGPDPKQKNVFRYPVRFKDNDALSKVQQIARAIARDVDRGILKKGQKLPSINEFSRQNTVARDTIEKAYRVLRNTGYLVSLPGRGYFILGKEKRRQRVLLVFNKLSSFKKIIFDEMVKSLSATTKLDLQVHHYDPKLLREILQTHLDGYDYYAIMPHFFSGVSQEEALAVLKIVPPDKLILLDRNIPVLAQRCRAVYQDFHKDIYEALYSLRIDRSRYRGITLVFPEGTHHPLEIIAGIRAYCNEQHLKFEQRPGTTGEQLQKATVYITIEDEDLAKLLKQVRNGGWVLGKDMGIISFNETVFKELLDITVITTDFAAMGRTAAQLIRGSEMAQLRNPFYTIRRNSL